MLRYRHQRAVLDEDRVLGAGAGQGHLITPQELAIQWDLAVENRLVDTALAREGGPAAETLAARLVAPVADIAPAIPQEVALGYHGCFGTLSGWPSRQPTDLGGTVTLLNEAIAATGRRVDFLHLPTLGTADDAFFAPLERLRAPDAKVYLGAIHHMHDADGLRRQLQTVRRHLAEFGLAAPCGFGRAPERPGRLLTAEGSARRYTANLTRQRLGPQKHIFLL